MPEPNDESAIHRLIDLAASAYAQELEDQVSSHPAIEDLIALQEGRLEPTRADGIVRHLAACPQCAEEVERLDTFDGEPPFGQSDPAAAVRSWERFREASEVGPASAGVETRVPPATGPISRAVSGWVLAASVVLAIAGSLALYFAGRASEGRHPGSEMELVGEGNLFLFDLLPDGAGIERGSVPASIEVPPQIDWIVIRLLLGDQTPYPSYSATLVDSQGETIWQQQGLRRQPGGSFALLIPRSRIDPGRYVLSLRGDEPDASPELASYRFRIADLE